MKIVQSLKVVLAATVLAIAGGLAFMAPASATFTCNQDSGVCTDDSVVDTPLGQVDVSVSDTNVVTVHLTPLYPRTSIVGIPQSHPPSPIRSGFTRTSVVTIAGTVDIDTKTGSENVALISFHPPSPCRVTSTGTTVVFTPQSLS